MNLFELSLPAIRSQIHFNTRELGDTAFSFSKKGCSYSITDETDNLKERNQQSIIPRIRCSGPPWLLVCTCVPHRPHKGCQRFVTGQEDKVLCGLAAPTDGHLPNQKWPKLHGLAAIIYQPHIQEPALKQAFHLDRESNHWQ